MSLAQAGLAGQRGDRLRVVAADDLHLDAGLGELLERVLDLGPQLVAEADEAERHQAGRQRRVRLLGRLAAARDVRLLVEGLHLRPVGEEQHPQAGAGPLVDLLLQAVGRRQVRGDHLRGAEHEGAAEAVVVDAQGAPLAGRGEDDLFDRAGGAAAEGLVQRRRRAVALGGAGGEAPSSSSQLCFVRSPAGAPRARGCCWWSACRSCRCRARRCCSSTPPSWPAAPARPCRPCARRPARRPERWPAPARRARSRRSPWTCARPRTNGEVVDHRLDDDEDLEGEHHRAAPSG